MHALRQMATAALAAVALSSPAATLPADTVLVFSQPVVGAAVDYANMCYNNRGECVSVAGEQILGAWVDLKFDPAQRQDAEHLFVHMVVPVVGAQSESFVVTAAQLIPVGNGRFRAMMTSSLHNGTVRTGRYSIETYGIDANGNPVSVQGRLTADSGFYFIVTRPDDPAKQALPERP